MTTPNHIAIIVTSYKDKNLKSFIENLSQNTLTDHSIEIFDQNPINRKNDFKDMPMVSYDHKIWDDMAGPSRAKSEKISSRIDNVTHICVISPDIVVSKNWDIKMLDFISANTIISGTGIKKISQKNLFEYGVSSQPSNDFTMSQIVDKNFIFGNAETFEKIRLPDFLKYSGEDEYWTLAFMSINCNIWSAPSNLYIDQKLRPIENTYHCFSAEHNYNLVIGFLKGELLSEYKLNKNAVDLFMNFHKLNPDDIKKLPYSPNDVVYNPYNLEMHGVDARRFISGTKAVY